MAHRQDVLRYFMSQPGTQYISGHFGINAETIKHYQADWQFITILRHPVARWLSHYYYNRDNPDSRHASAAHFRIHEPLEAFMDSERGIALGALYANHFAIDGLESPADTKAAIDNLSRFTLIGFLDELDTFQQRLGQLLGRRLRLKHTNRSPTPASRQHNEINDTIKARLEEICAPDIGIYNAAKQLPCASLANPQ